MMARSLLPFALALGAGAQNVDYTSLVDTFYGSDETGHTFPGVVAEPFAMVKLGPDCASGTDDAYSGYLADGNITGFSMMHESGTGGAPKYGVVSQMPVVGNVSNPLEDLGVTRSSADSSSVGYYHSSLSNGVEVELAGTAHAGLFNYTFPSSGSGSIVVDVSHVLPSFRGLGWGQNYSQGNITTKTDGSYQGSGTYNGGWNLGKLSLLPRKRGAIVLTIRSSGLDDSLLR
jgi:putative alpha-1,2-mannosidase